MADTQSKGTVYVCGPMRGLPLFNFPYFYQSSSILELWGYKVVNPARMDIDEGRAHFNHNTGDVILDNSFRLENALRRDFKEIIDKCDAIVVLPGWDSSSGGQREVAFAISVGLPIFKMPETVGTVPLDIESDTPMDVHVTVNCYEKVPPEDLYEMKGINKAPEDWDGDLGGAVS